MSRPELNSLSPPPGIEGAQAAKSSPTGTGKSGRSSSLGARKVTHTPTAAAAPSPLTPAPSETSQGTAARHPFGQGDLRLPHSREHSNFIGQPTAPQ